MNILIADDHAIVRKGLVQLLREEFHFADITEAANSADVLDKAKGKIWDVILLDAPIPFRTERIFLLNFGFQTSYKNI